MIPTDSEDGSQALKHFYKCVGTPWQNAQVGSHTANAGNFTTAGDVSTETLTASGAATAVSFAATDPLMGATLTVSGAASAGPLDCESLDCTFTATSGGASTGSVVCGDVTSSGTVSAPQLFASNTLTVTNTSE